MRERAREKFCPGSVIRRADEILAVRQVYKHIVEVVREDGMVTCIQQLDAIRCPVIGNVGPAKDGMDERLREFIREINISLSGMKVTEYSGTSEKE